MTPRVYRMRSAIAVAAVLLFTTTASAALDVRAMVEPYFRIQLALHADSLDGVSNDARTIAMEAAQLGSNGESIRAAADAFQRASDLQTARAALGVLSDAIIAFARHAPATLGDGVEVAYCPMARKHWLQKGKTIQNPFYGKAMSDCGRIAADGLASRP